MAHGRTGPDIVMTARYVGMPQISTMDEHEENRNPDGTSAIDPYRSELNMILHGPKTQGAAIEALLGADGVKKPATQSETPFVQMVLSASPEYFRTIDQKAGEWHAGKMREWRAETMKWLKKEYGRDLAHVSLHLDENTPHMHILVVPTYDKKPRMPGRQRKNETAEEFKSRKDAAENAETVRAVGRSSNSYWKRAFARRYARKSYHAAMEPLGLGYGKDFIDQDEPSPKRKETGVWVREKSAEIKEEQVKIAEEWEAIEATKADLTRRAEDLDRREGFFKNVVQRVWDVAEAAAKIFGIPLPKKISAALDDLETAIESYNDQTHEPDDTLGM